MSKRTPAASRHSGTDSRPGVAGKIIALAIVAVAGAVFYFMRAPQEASAGAPQAVPAEPVRSGSAKEPLESSPPQAGAQPLGGSADRNQAKPPIAAVAQEPAQEQAEIAEGATTLDELIARLELKDRIAQARVNPFGAR